MGFFVLLIVFGELSNVLDELSLNEFYSSFLKNISLLFMLKMRFNISTLNFDDKVRYDHTI
ncbi:hypothetical protein B0180_09050 [Moraxella canis]|uniref:Uncharacterized protein n=1 Tax=Moraxella canis TaxID=90239 RepID=A0A1S9ZHQ1_9GAMM|nr:hypothetical protein B0180_09050 [Moraxella canis]